VFEVFGFEVHRKEQGMLKQSMMLCVVAGAATTALGQWSGIPFYHSVHQGDFVMGGTTTRDGVSFGDPAPITIAGIPAGSTIVAAYLNWNYLTSAPGGGGEPAVTLDGFSISASKMESASPDLCWGFSTTTAYYADVTSLISGNGTYFLGGAGNDGGTGGFGEGASIAVVYSNPLEPTREINLYCGVVGSDTTGGTAVTPHSFVTMYPGGPLHFAINGLDGQAFPDEFFIEGIPADAYGGVGAPGNAWPGALGAFPSDNLYDIKDGDASPYVLPGFGFTSYTLITGDCIGHTFSGVSFLPAPGSIGVLALAGLASSRRRRS
jgi:hypothetical protein